MKYCPITDLQTPVSRIIAGTMVLDSENQEKSNSLLDSMYELGINTFDTALVYGNGSEVALGRWIHSRNLHDKVNIITKGAHPSPFRNRVTSYDILSDCNESLARLGTEIIDIYMLHRDDLRTPVSEIIDTLNQLYNEGKIRTFGVSNWTHERIKEANTYASCHNLKPISSSSPNYSLAEQLEDPWGGGCVSISGPENKKARTFYRETQMPIFSYSSLGRRFFSGMLKSNAPETAYHILDQWACKGYAHPSNFERLKRCEELAEKLHLSIPQIAMAWLFSQPENVCAIIGASSSQHMKENIAALNIHLTSTQAQYLNLELTHCD